MAYVDSFVLPVKKDRLDEYRKFAKLSAEIWREHGALEYEELIADDVQPGQVTSYPQSLKLEPDETVVVQYVKYESREHRDKVNALAMKDPRMQMEPKDMPFDGKRMFWGGFVPFRLS